MYTHRALHWPTHEKLVRKSVVGRPGGMRGLQDVSLRLDCALGRAITINLVLLNEPELWRQPGRGMGNGGNGNRNKNWYRWAHERQSNNDRERGRQRERGQSINRYLRETVAAKLIRFYLRSSSTSYAKGSLIKWQSLEICQPENERAKNNEVKKMLQVWLLIHLRL